MADAGYLTIGKVVKKLQGQYPDLSVSKVRYLEDEGLITPSSRTPGGYRLYSARDVGRLETILYLQKTQFLPLQVIKDKLDNPGSDEVVGICSGSLRDIDLAVDADTASKYHALERIPEILGISISFVRQLESIGMISFSQSPHGRELIDGQDLPLIKACDSLRRFGIEPKNLRQYVTAANRECGLFEQALVVFAHKQGESTEAQQKQFDEAFEQMLALVNAIRVSLIKKKVNQDFSVE